MYVCCIILISFGSSWLIFKSGNTLGCVNGFINISNDNARGKVLRPIPFASVGAVDDGAELAAVGAGDPSVVVGLLATGVWGAVTGGVGVVNTLVGFNGLTGETGLAIFVGLVSDFVQVLAVVIHVPFHTGCA